MTKRGARGRTHTKFDPAVGSSIDEASHNDAITMSNSGTSRNNGNNNSRGNNNTRGGRSRRDRGGRRNTKFDNDPAATTTGRSDPSAPAGPPPTTTPTSSLPNPTTTTTTTTYRSNNSNHKVSTINDGGGRGSSRRRRNTKSDDKINNTTITNGNRNHYGIVRNTDGHGTDDGGGNDEESVDPSLASWQDRTMLSDGGLDVVADSSDDDDGWSSSVVPGAERVRGLDYHSTTTDDDDEEEENFDGDRDEDEERSNQDGRRRNVSGSSMVEITEAQLVVDDSNNNNNNEVNVRDIEQRVRDKLIHDAVDVMPVNNKRLYMKISLIVVFVAIIVGVVVAVVVGKGIGGPEKKLPLEDLLITLLLPYYNNETDWFIRDNNNNNNKDGVGSIEATTPQYLAYQWMINNDTESRTLVERKYNNSDNNDIAVTDKDYDRLLLERYALTVLYFSTNNYNNHGDHEKDIIDNEGWKDKYDFLNPRISVCDWIRIRLNYNKNKNGNNSSDSSFISISDRIGNNDGQEEAEEEESSGLECDPDTDQVTFLYLTNNGLNGTIPFELSFLTSLQELHLSLNNLYGSIPSDLGQELRQLRELRFAHNLLSGLIPESFGELGGLQVLIAFNNRLSGSIPSSLTQLSQLRKLLLGTNMLNGTIPDFRIRTGIELVALDDNHLIGSIPSSIYKNSDLAILELSGNSLNGTISPSVGSLANLQVLRLGENELSGTIPSEIGLLEDVYELTLDHNLLEGTLPTELGLLLRLTRLWLDNNRLTGELDVAVFEDLKRLVVWDMHSNQFVGSIPSSVASLNLLRIFAIHNNSFTGDISPLICNRTETSDSKRWFDVREPYATADCGGFTPEVNCDCCSKCCDDSIGCSTLTAVEACERDIHQFELAWQYEIRKAYGCSDDDCDSGGNFEARENPNKCSCHPHYGNDAWYTRTCESAGGGPMLCNGDERIDCVVNKTFGYHYDGEGQKVGFFESSQYAEGSYEGKTVRLDESYEGHERSSFCNVEVDGTRCESCIVAICDDGHESFIVECNNFQDGTRYDGCSSETSLGILKTLRSGYDWQGLYHPLTMCRELAKTVDFPCRCSDDGTSLICDGSECEYCLGEKIANNDNCFHWGFVYEFTTPFKPELSSATKYTFVAGSYIGTVVSFNDVSQITPDDGVCEIAVNDEVCETCNFVVCPFSNRTALQVNCENLDNIGLRAVFDGCNEMSWDESGPLQIFRPDVYDAENLLSLLNCRVDGEYGWCPFFANAFNEDEELEEFNCQCNRDGSYLSCTDVSCNYCWESWCMEYGAIAHLDAYDELHFNTAFTRFVASEPFIEGTIVSLNDTNINFDATCDVQVNGQRCSSCFDRACNEPVVLQFTNGTAATYTFGLLIDCENVLGAGGIFDGCNRTTWETSGLLQAAFYPGELLECLPQ